MSRLVENVELFVWAKSAGRRLSETQATNQTQRKAATLTPTKYGNLVDRHGVVFIHVLGVRSHSWNQSTINLLLVGVF